MTKVLPAAAISGGAFDFLNYFKKMKEADGIMVNTFYDLESHATDSILNDGKTPRVYPVGPILSKKSELFDEDDDVKKWLDDQPENSVVFLCFGTMGSLDENQVREIAKGLENCGYRFLWSLRKAGEKQAKQMVVEYDDFEQVLPEGFLERSKGVGKVIGWAPQVAVLAHPAVGGIHVALWVEFDFRKCVVWGVDCYFPALRGATVECVSACEGIGQLGMVEMIRLDYKIDFRGEGLSEIVGAGEIEGAIRWLMAAKEGSGVRWKVEHMREKARGLWWKVELLIMLKIFLFKMLLGILVCNLIFLHLESWNLVCVS